MKLAVPVRRAPTAEIREALADAWNASAWHEAGHAVIQASAGLPVHRAEIRFRCLRSIGAEHWGVTARTRMTAGAGCFRRITRDDLVTIMAGAAAEALWLHDAKGVSTVAARREARESAADDYRMALRFAKGDRLAVLDATDEATVQVCAWRPAIEQVAAMLAGHGSVTGDQVRAIVDAVSRDLEAAA